MPNIIDKYVKSIKKQNPSWPMSRVYATAWSNYKKGKEKE